MKEKLSLVNEFGNIEKVNVKIFLKKSIIENKMLHSLLDQLENKGF